MSEAGGTADEPIEFLSDAWVAAADAALARLTPVPGPLVVAVTVTGGRGGDHRYRLVLGPDRVGAEPGPGPAAVTMTMSLDLAVAVNQGRESAQRAFLDGRLVLGGDPVVLLGHASQLAAVDDTLAPLRARTRFG
ncbi:MAG: SCP2 sterol-binding domain-containing protein [Acidimicrobiia bacterium]|nr:SCP2 sterol-binding domain-containing protein [Acidimicrobiia bacterium]